jgi:hypothetical protein
MAGVLKLIWVSEEAQYFCKRGWTAEIDLPVRHLARRVRTVQYGSAAEGSRSNCRAARRKRSADDWRSAQADEQAVAGTAIVARQLVSFNWKERGAAGWVNMVPNWQDKRSWSAVLAELEA